ncbi:MAG: hypothetical protein M0D57_09435 [Sphingobacteriales bacterium JAD_PAG50586_3]|nr:MAG: hypothetical protein M0D57_09435 [Sphingobacteriales bacterium JAD_PAG50586_3]
MMKTFTRFICLLVVLLSISGRITAQDFTGYINSQYSGAQGMFYQPASIADSRYLVDINLLSGGFNVYNNVVGIDPYTLRRPSTFNESGFEDKYLTYNLQDKNRGSIALNIYGPSFMATLNQTMALGVSSRFRTGVSFNNLSKEIVDMARNGFDEQSLFNVQLNEKNARISTHSWAEYGITWG